MFKKENRKKIAVEKKNDFCMNKWYSESCVGNKLPGI